MIRGQLASRADVNAPGQGQRTTQKQANAQTRTYSPENLDGLIWQRIKNIARDDPKRGRKAFHIFLEAILLSHFGEQLINDPKFYQMIDDIQNSMEADPELRKMIDSAVEHLLSGAQ